MEKLLAPFQERFTPFEEMTREDLEEELQNYRNLWTWIPENVKFWLTRIGFQVRIALRTSQAYLGELHCPQFEVKEHELRTIHLEYNYNDGKQYIEDKIVRIPASSVNGVHFIFDMQEKETPAGPNMPFDDDYTTEEG